MTSLTRWAGWLSNPPRSTHTQPYSPNHFAPLWIWVDRGQFESEPASLKREIVGPEEVRLYKSRDHHQNFLDCVRSRGKTITPAETAHRSASVGHLGVIAMEVGRKIRWDPKTETILGDPEAERLLGHSYRKPWQLPE